jgi:diguanylate cyclase (GGDEF)-like protein/PAS domain S-box-containing protein
MVRIADYRFKNSAMATIAAMRSKLKQVLQERFSRLGIRGRLVLLVLALGLPFLGYVAISAIQQVAHERQVAKERSLAIARVVAARLDDYVGDINQVLGTLSAVVPTAHAATASNDALLRGLGPNLPSHVNNLAVWDMAGENVGSLDPTVRIHPFSIADRQYFRAALEGAAPAIEAPIVSRSNSQRIATFARPVKHNGNVVGVVTSSLRLAELPAVLDPRSMLPPESVITVFDQRGVILGRSIDAERWIGQSVSSQPGIMNAIKKGEGTAESGTGFDGVARLGGFTTARAVPWFVYVGVPVDAALAPLRAQLTENLLLAAAALLLGLVVAALIGESIAQPLRRLAGDASILAEGNLDHRSAISHGGEIGALATSLNAMTEALRERAREQVQSQERLRMIADNIPAFVSYIDREHRYRFVNASYQDIFGLKPEELIGKTLLEVWGEKLYKNIKPKIDEALAGLPVHFEPLYDSPKGRRSLKITYFPDYGDGTGDVRGVYAMGLDVTTNKALEAKLARMAQYDQLTGLPNRYLLHDRLAQACARSAREGIQLAVFYLDLNEFKRVNDTLGHDTGDEILKEFAQRLTGALRASDTVARIGGDEFVVLMEGFHSYRHLELLAKKIITLAERPFTFGGESFVMSTSVGGATFPPAKTWEELLKTADAAMYEAKSSGCGVVIAPIKAEARPRLAWSNAKHEA